MIAFFFYIWAFLAIGYEGWKLSLNNFGLINNLREKVILNKGLESKEFAAKFTHNQLVYIMLSLFYVIWCCVGLFTSQWFLFLFILGLSQFHRIKSLKADYTWNVIDGVLTIAILLTIVINKYHLHINIPKEIWNSLF